ncbi:MAG: winged helix-turn-helix domain-containing protein [Anaerolineaceae bacterium]
MDNLTIDSETARMIIIQSQLLNSIPSDSQKGNGVAEIVENLGYVQIDTINVLNRAHHHTLWTRMPHYESQDLHQAQAEQKRIFEYWGHAMSYLPMADYRYFLPYKLHFSSPYGSWAKDRLEKYGHIMEPTLQRIREEGPLATKDFISEETDHRAGTWWDWRPVKMALELLFWQGKLMVAERKKFQKVYDLPERVLPDWVDTSMPSEEELGRFLVQRALKAYGLATEREIVDHLRVAEKKIIVAALKEMCAAGEVITVTVKMGEKELTYYVFPETLEKGNAASIVNNEVFIFSPFDNFCIQRARMKILFNFDYALECYLKPEQRTFGYFALPLFWKERFIGKMDAKADRKEKALLIHHLQFEEDFKPDETFQPALHRKLTAFAKFQDCEHFVVEKISPVRSKKLLQSVQDK